MNRLELIRLARSVIKTFKNVDSEASCDFGIAPIEFEIITLISEYENCNTTKDIEQAGEFNAHTVAVHIEKLVNEGYLTKARLRGNRRKIALTLTEKAKPIAKRGRELHEQILMYLYDGLTPEEITVMEKGLTVVSDNAIKLI